MNLKTLIHRSLRCCLHCGAFSTTESLFCQICESHLWRRHPKLSRFELYNGTEGLALFDWIPDQDRKVSKLMISLKGGKQKAALMFYAEIFSGKVSKKLNPHSVLVPCPSRSGRLHSQVLAEALGTVLGLPVWNVLQMPEGTSQKAKSRAERSRVKIRNDVDFSQQHVIFIDDILTTGATALSAQMAIGRCRSFEVWCLAHRRQLAASLEI